MLLLGCQIINNLTFVIVLHILFSLFWIINHSIKDFFLIGIFSQNTKRQNHRFKLIITNEIY